MKKIIKNYKNIMKNYKSISNYFYKLSSKIIKIHQDCIMEIFANSWKDAVLSMVLCESLCTAILQNFPKIFSIVY